MGTDSSGVLGVIGLAIAGFYFFGSDQKVEAKKPYTDQIIAEIKAPPLHDGYRHALNQVAEHFREAYRSTDNEVKKGQYRLHRGRTICENFPSLYFDGWQVKVDTVSVQSDGVDIKRLIFEVGDHVTFVTDDIIRRGSAMHKQFLNDIAEGDTVYVSGSFEYDIDEKVSDCFLEKSISLTGGMEDPEFHINLAKISKNNAKAQP